MVKHLHPFFALKSVSIVVYIGLLYTASGVLFPLPVALIINTVGTAVTLSIPYIVGKKLGVGTVSRVLKKYPKLQAIRDAHDKNDFAFSFLVRLIGGLPTDIVSLFMGAMSVHYPRYLVGGFLGLLPRMVIYSVIGMSAIEMNLPIFISAISLELLMLLVTTLIARRKELNKNIH